MPLTLFLIRHGNTFDKGDTVLRVGKRTDLLLSSSGREQARKLGLWLKKESCPPVVVFTSTLKRTIETAGLALISAEMNAPITTTPDLDEIDYGIDDGQPETTVIARLGTEALENWEKDGILPSEWSPRPDQIEQTVSTMKVNLARCFKNDDCIWIVTSNGIARFFAKNARWIDPKPDTLKLGTGACARLEWDEKDWHIKSWNIRPE